MRLVLCLCLAALALPATARASTSYAGSPRRVAGFELPAAVQGPEISLATSHGFAPRFWAGVNLGATVPGSQPGEVAPARADYDRWLAGIGRLGAHVVRVYTILRPSFYAALAAYDHAHPRAPLYVIQGVWIPEDEFLATGNAYDPSVTDGFDSEIADAVAVVHGDARLPRRPGHASGRYRTDVSRWLLAWSPGIEWDPFATKSTDDLNAGVKPFQGRYFSATPDATPLESWITARLDRLATLEAQRGWSRPITFTNWLTADPLHHPDEPLAKEDMVSVDAMHVHANPAWPGGFFASYHAYPYYPDFMGLQPDLRSARDPYAAYLRDLRADHARQAVMITEFGVPSGLGSAHNGPLGRGQGDHSETQMGSMDAAMLRDVKAQGYAGGIAFEWIDEWFKRTWNTQDFAIPADRRQLWHDVLTNEAHFGLVAAEPGRRPAVVLDGRGNEWARNGSTVVLRGRGPVGEVRATSDAAYLYLLVHRRGSTPFQVGLDVRGGGNRGLPGRPGVDPAADVAVTVGARSARIAWAASSDPFSFMYGLAFRYVPVDPTALAAGSGAWVDPRLMLDRPYIEPATGAALPVQYQDLARMRWGRAPDAGGTDDRVLADGTRGTVELRVPWGLLTYADPSSHRIWVPHADGSIATATGGPIGIAVAARGGAAQVGKAYRFRGWNRVAWHERVKAGWRTLARAYAAVGR